VKSSYQKNSFSFFIQFLERISIFLLTHFLSIPSSLQDGVIHFISTSGLGYLIPTFMKLYEISPVLVIVFVIVLLLLIHFLIRLDDQERKNMLRDMSKKPSISPSSLEKSTSIENVERELVLLPTQPNQLKSKDSVELSSSFEGQDNSKNREMVSFTGTSSYLLEMTNILDDNSSIESEVDSKDERFSSSSTHSRISIGSKTHIP